MNRTKYLLFVLTILILATTIFSYVYFDNNFMIRKWSIPLAPPGFLDAHQLTTKKPLLKEFDLLPASFRRPDYSKTLIVILLTMNIVALLGLAGIKEYRHNSRQHNDGQYWYLQSSGTKRLCFARECRKMKLETRLVFPQ